MPIDLKPCPFCGGKAEMHLVHSALTNTHPIGAWILCRDCEGATRSVYPLGGVYEGHKEALAKVWNKRYMGKYFEELP